ncbi:hypothetical protein [Photobacterium phosphoreum]|uniref:hypothetical protein n=1 Tax=Photobacterium phosphoreum TaxID=659 RepID=UPI000D16529B|nr:hypothetical protein [Photobacterium phosphoreum]PSU64242.1 hypothetical protein CTM75_06750 [Photobacterium phosphoreum]
MRLTRRGWNNVIIIGVLAFIAVIQLPELLRTRLATTTSSTASLIVSSTVIPLFASDRVLQQLILPQVTLQHSKAGWQSQPPIVVDIATFIGHWQTLKGTKVTAKQLLALKKQLLIPYTIEAWLVGYSQPQRITAYQLAHFWLLNNGAGQWLAVTVDSDFLFPPLSSKR